MPRLPRVFQKIFGSAAGGAEIGKFGSLAAGTPQTTSDPAQMQSLANWLGGWYSAIVGPNSPAIEDMNAVHYVMAYQLAYMMENGIPQYDATTTYYQGSVVQYLNQHYKCLVDNTLGVTPAIGANWQYMSDALYSKADPTGHSVATGTTVQSQLDSLDAGLGQFTPSGIIYPYAGVVVPSGFLLCDGKAYSRTTYANLFTAIGTRYGYGDNATTFNVPDLRYNFLRGAASQIIAAGSGTASGNQATFTNHGFNRTGMIVRLSTGTLSGLVTNLDYYVIVVDDNTLAFATTYANAINNVRIPISGTNTGTIRQWEDPEVNSRLQAAVGGATSGSGTRQFYEIQAHQHIFDTDNAGAVNLGGNAATGGNNSVPPTKITRVTGGFETRPINIYVNFIIKV